MNIPPDLENPSGTSPNGQSGGLMPDPALDMNLRGKSSKTPLIIVLVLALGGGGFFAFHTWQQHNERKEHAAFMDSFAAVENDDLAKFWTCILGPTVNPSLIKDNLQLSARVEGAFSLDPKSYPGKVREDCTPKAVQAAHKMESLTGPDIYTAPLKKYSKSITELASSFDEWAKVAPAQMAEREVARKVGVDGAAWHALEGGKPSNEVIAYDRFLHCAVPNVDTMKDGQVLVEFLFNQCKNPAYVQRIQTDCGKEVTTDPPGPPTKGMMTALKKLQSDDRELSAFDDCLRKGRKAKRKDDLEGVGKAWVGYVEDGEAVRKLGRQALSDK